MLIEDMLIQPFVADHSVVALDIRALLQLARLDVPDADVWRFSAQASNLAPTYSGPLSTRMLAGEPRSVPIRAKFNVIMAERNGSSK